MGREERFAAGSGRLSPPQEREVAAGSAFFLLPGRAGARCGAVAPRAGMHRRAKGSGREVSDTGARLPLAAGSVPLAAALALPVVRSKAVEKQCGRVCW